MRRLSVVVCVVVVCVYGVAVVVCCLLIVVCCLSFVARCVGRLVGCLSVGRLVGGRFRLVGWLVVVGCLVAWLVVCVSVCCVSCCVCCSSGSGCGGRGGRGGCGESGLFEFISVTFSALGRNHIVSTQKRTEVYVCGVCGVYCVLCTVCDVHCVVLYGVCVCTVCGVRISVVCGVAASDKKKRGCRVMRAEDLAAGTHLRNPQSN